MPKIEVSVGELLDKYSILKIKQERFSSVSQVEQVELELNELEPLVREILEGNGILIEYQKLYEVNLQIWFGMEEVFADREETNFGELSRRITDLNKERSFSKREINVIAKSKIKEEKSYFAQTKE